jgi:hypothetical protein
MILAIPLVSSPVMMRFSSDAPLSQVIIDIVYGIGFSTLPVNCQDVPCLVSPLIFTRSVKLVFDLSATSQDHWFVEYRRIETYDQTLIQLVTASNWEKQLGQDDFLERFQLVPTPWLRNSEHLTGIRDSTVRLPSAQEGGNFLLHWGLLSSKLLLWPGVKKRKDLLDC